MTDTEMLDWLERWLLGTDPPQFIDTPFRQGRRVFWLYKLRPRLSPGVPQEETVAEAPTLRGAIEQAAAR